MWTQIGVLIAIVSFDEIDKRGHDFVGGAIVLVGIIVLAILFVGRDD